MYIGICVERERERGREGFWCLLGISLSTVVNFAKRGFLGFACEYLCIMKVFVTVEEVIIKIRSIFLLYQIDTSNISIRLGV